MSGVIARVLIGTTLATTGAALVVVHICAAEGRALDATLCAIAACLGGAQMAVLSLAKKGARP